ncbi:hypothetical protein ACIF8W_09105 [Streptomyces sp. NPDC085639]|uniref:hypothetical protein n=1 Tax=Streptomyces sp. NPDC085639 TaxID=3365734 RepID=UPI0037D21AB9
MKNRNRSRNRALAVAGSAALLATLMAAAPAPAAPAGARLASVHGLGTVFHPYSPDDDIRFTVDATSASWTRPLPAQGGEKGLPTDAFGKITVYHHVTATGCTAVSEAEVDCPVTGGRTATVTAVVKTSNVGWEGRRIGIGVQDGTRGEPDRVGFSWDIANLDVRPDGSVFEPSAGTCLAPAPFTEVTRGGYKVTPAPLAPRPKP